MAAMHVAMVQFSPNALNFKTNKIDQTEVK
jgi:hypothetical protein